jgi:hypothetical protein
MDAHIARDRGFRESTQQYAERWARQLPPCRAVKPEQATLTGRLTPSGRGYSTEMACDKEIHCCNSFQPNAMMLIPEGQTERVVLELTAGTPFLPYVDGTGALDCEWPIWQEKMALTQVRVAGTWFDVPARDRGPRTRARGIRVESICNPRSKIPGP